MEDYKNISKARRCKYLLFMFFLLCVFLLLYALNKQAPLFSDDWYYSFIFEPNQKHSTRIETISDVIISQYKHYLHWGGRSVVHTIDQLLLMTSFNTICILNSLVFTSFIYLIYKMSNRGGKTNFFLLLAVFLLVWFAVPFFSESILWKTGSVNYLWGGLIFFLFLFPYYNFFRSLESKSNLLKSIGFFFFGIIAGWTNENMSIALLVFIAIVISFSYFKKRNIPQWAIFGFIGAIIGCAFLLLAPGNFVRIEEMKAMYGWSDFSFFRILGIISHRTLDFFLKNILPLISIYLILFFLYRKFPKDKRTYKLNVYSSFLFICMAFIAFIATVGSIVFPERALFGIVILLIISIGILYANIAFSNRYIRYFNLIIIGVFLFVFVKGYSVMYKDFETITVIFKEREKSIEEQRNLGEDSIIFTKALDPVARKYYIWDLTSDPNGWTNKGYALYHGIKSVKLVEDKNDVIPSN